MYDQEIEEIRQLKKELESKFALLQKIYESIYAKNAEFLKKERALIKKIANLNERIKELEEKCRIMGM